MTVRLTGKHIRTDRSFKPADLVVESGAWHRAASVAGTRHVSFRCAVQVNHSCSSLVICANSVKLSNFSFHSRTSLSISFFELMLTTEDSSHRNFWPHHVRNSPIKAFTHPLPGSHSVERFHPRLRKSLPAVRFSACRRPEKPLGHKATRRMMATSSHS